MADNELGLEAVFENEDFHNGIREYNQDIDAAESNTSSAGSIMSDVWSGMAAVGEAAFTAIAAGIGAFVTELGLAVAAALDAEDAMARVSFVVEGVADRTGVTTAEVEDLAGALSNVLPIDDEVIAQAIAMGLTFDGVNQDNIQPLISAAADLAAWTGGDLPSAMKNLSLAITDPDRAMRLFKEANITLTDEQKKTLKSMGDLGDTAGVTQFILERLGEKGILGLGEVMGDTAKGKITIMQTALGNLQESLGTGLLDALTDVIERITNFANDPRTIQFFTELGLKVGDFASQILANVPSIIDALIGLGDWFKNNQAVIVGILAAIGAALVVFGATAAATAIATLASFAPLIAALAVIGVAAGLLFKAWSENWGGVQDKVKAAWKQIKPIFDQLQKWLKDNLPKVIAVLAKLWSDTLLPAIKEVFTWIVDNALPILVDVVQWLGENVPKAIETTSKFFTNTLLPAIKAVGDWIKDTLIPALQSFWTWLQNLISRAVDLANTIRNVLISALNTLSGIWTGVLLPALQAVYSFIQNNIMPIFNAVSNLMNAVLGLAVRVLAGLWQNVLYPALQAVWSVIQNVMTAFQNVASALMGPIQSATSTIANLWQNTLRPAIQAVWDKLQPFATFLNTTLRNAFNGILGVIQDVVEWINDLADIISNLELPDWLTPGSPTPFEIGLKGINEELKKMSSGSFPAVRHQLELMNSARDVSGISTGVGASTNISNSSQSSRTNLFGVNFNIPGPSGFIEALQGL